MAAAAWCVVSQRATTVEKKNNNKISHTQMINKNKFLEIIEASVLNQQYNILLLNTDYNLLDICSFIQNKTEKLFIINVNDLYFVFAPFCVYHLDWQVLMFCPSL